MASTSFFDEVSLSIREGVAVLTLLGESGTLPWGTSRQEHRFNPVMLRAMTAALDAVERDDSVNVLVVTNKGKFWSNGMDLNYLDKHPDEAANLLKQTDRLIARICCFPRSTVAAIRGHWCATGGMMGLAFDFRLMSRDAGFFFIPAVDLGLVFSPFQTQLMKAKLPRSMHRDVLLFNSRRWTGWSCWQPGSWMRRWSATRSCPGPRRLQRGCARREQGRPERRLVPLRGGSTRRSSMLWRAE